MNYHSLTLAALLSFLVLSRPSQIDAINGVSVHTLIDNACKNNTSYLVILGQNTEISSATDALSLAKIALRAVSNYSSSIVAFINCTIKSHLEAAKPLGECLSLFQGTEWQLTDGVGYCDWEGGFATLDVHYAFDNVGVCEFRLKEAKVNIPALGVMITEWKTLFSPAYDATEVAEGHKPDCDLE